MKKKGLLIALTFSMIVTCAVQAKAKTPSLNKKKVTIAVGKKYRLKVKHKGAKKVKWSSSNKKVVTVKSGLITAKKMGTAKIRAKVGKKTLTCKVVVKKTGATKTQDSNTNNTNSSNSKPGTTPKPGAKPTATPKPGAKPTATPKPGTEATATPNSIINAPTADPNTRDDGWIPGWY